MIDDIKITRAKENIKTLEELYRVTKSVGYLDKIEEEHKKIRKIQAKTMNTLD